MNIRAWDLTATLRRVFALLVVSSLLAACGGGGGGGNNTPQNKPPVANAGIDAVVREAEAITFDGSISADTDGTIASYAWSASGTDVTLENANTATPGFTAPDVAADTDVVLTLEVTDNKGGKATDTLTVTVFHHVDGNTVPTPVVKPVPEAAPGDTIELNGSDSLDDNGQVTAYEWRQLAGPVVELTGADSPIAFFQAPVEVAALATTSVAETNFLFRLFVTDDSGERNAIDVPVIVKPAGDQLPVANAGVHQDVNADPDVTVTLDGSGSSDEETLADALQFAWIQVIDSEDDIEVTLDNPNIATPSFTPPIGITEQITLAFELTVTDSAQQTATASTTVTVSPLVAGNVLPEAVIEANGQTGTIEVAEGIDVTLDGSDSSDADGSIVKYQWVQLGATPQTAVELRILEDGLGAEFTTPGVAGPTTLTFQLTVTDNQGAFDTAGITVNVTDTNLAPLAVAKANGKTEGATALEGTTVTLDGSASTDDAGITSYVWETEEAGITLAPHATNPALATFTAPDVAFDEEDEGDEYEFTLTVSDGELVRTDSVSILIRANQPPQNVSAGNERTVNAGDVVTLVGTGSDPESRPFTNVAWTQITGAPTVTLVANPTNPFSATFTAPDNITIETPLTFELSVTDDHQQRVTSSVVITVMPQNNQPPVAVITGPGNVDEGATITLSGINSTDQQPLTYQWAQVSGTLVSLPPNTTSSAIGFPAPNVTADETLQFSLTVSDGILQHTAFHDVLVRALDQTPEPFGFDPMIRLPDGGVERTNGIIVTGFEGSLPVNVTVTGAVGAAALEIAGFNRASGAPIKAGETLVVRVGARGGATSTGTVEVEIGGVTASVPVTYTSFPTANAGSDRSVLADAVVTLDGVTSTDSDGTIVSYSWSQTDGNAAVDLTATGSTATFTAPSVPDDATFIFTLVVTDDAGATDDDIVAVLVRAAGTPTAVVTGGPETIDEGSSFTLSAVGSSDPATQALTYLWTQTDGTMAEFPSGTAGETLEVIAPQVPANEPLTFSLVVTNEDGIASEPASQTVTVVHVPDTQPDAESFQFGPVFASTDANFTDTDELTPAGFDTPVAVNVSATGNTGALSLRVDGTTRASGTPIEPGQTLAIRIGANATSSTGTVQVEIGGVTTSFPVTHTDIPIARAGEDRDVLTGTLGVLLDGSQSSDDDGIASFEWIQTAGAPVTLTGAESATASFDASAVTEDAIFTFKLVVTDNVGAASEDFVSIRVRPANNAPDAQAGADQTVGEGDMVELNAGGSSDQDGDGLTYSWVQLGGSPVQLTNNKTASLTFTAPPALGDNYFMVFQVTVDDSNFEGIDSDAVVINVQNTVANFTLDFPLPKALTDAPLAGSPIITYRGHASAANGSDVLSVTVNNIPATTYDPDTGAWTYEHLIAAGVQPIQIVVTETSNETMQIDAMLEHVEDRRTHPFLVPSGTFMSGMEGFDISADGERIYLTTSVDNVNEFDIRNGSMRTIEQTPRDELQGGLALSVDPLGDRVLLAARSIEGVFGIAGIGDVAVDGGVATIISHDFDANANGIDFGSVLDMVMDYETNVAYVTDLASGDRRLIAIDLATGIRSVLAEDQPGARLTLDAANNRLLLGGCEISAFNFDTHEVIEIFPSAPDFCVLPMSIAEGGMAALGLNGNGGVGGTPAISEFDFETGNHVALSDFSNRNLGPASRLSSAYRDVAFDSQRDAVYVLDYTANSSDPWGVIMVDRQTGQRVMIFQSPGN